MRPLLLALLLVNTQVLTACSHAKPEIAPDSIPLPISEQRAQVLYRDVAWLWDTVPILKFRPPYIYGQWRLVVEQCSGKSKDGWPAFYVSPVSPLGPDGRLGFYAPDTKSIVFALSYEGEQWIVMHELLHFLLDPHDPENPHPDRYFGKDSPCAPFVRPPAR